MACYYPHNVYQKNEPNENGKKPIRFKPAIGYDSPIQIPCGNCIGCRLEYSRQWAIRCIHEASLHEDNCFITLTYSDEHLPENGTLVKKDFQDFMKRLRRKLERREFGKIKYYMCGEYGEKTYRPHYHACIFGFDFPDKIFWSQNKQGDNLYISKLLEDTWQKGYVRIGSVTFQSAAYVARYVMKKAKGKKAKEISDETGLRFYERINTETGEIVRLQPEYTNQSRGGRQGKGIASGWFENYKSDVYPSDFLVVNGKKMKPPRYYDSLFELEEPETFENIKQRRKEHALESEDNTPQRLEQRRINKQAQLGQLIRSL